MPGEPRLIIDIGRQCLHLMDGARVFRSYAVSTALNGVGERIDSECTPRGLHAVRAKIGAGLAPGAVLEARRPTGEVWNAALAAQQPDRDWILSRILWLSGLEPGRNRLGTVDSMRRYIYIHGTPDDQPMGVPGSHGCIRTRNQDVIELNDLVPPGTVVEIVENAHAGIS